MLAFQDGKLLAQGEVLKDEAMAGAKNANYSSAPESKKVEHGGNLIADQTFICLPMLLISKADGIVTRDSSNVSSSPRALSSKSTPEAWHKIRQGLEGNSPFPSPCRLVSRR